jgi:hypothetical protein
MNGEYVFVGLLAAFFAALGVWAVGTMVMQGRQFAAKDRGREAWSAKPVRLLRGGRAPRGSVDPTARLAVYVLPVVVFLAVLGLFLSMGVRDHREAVARDQHLRQIAATCSTAYTLPLAVRQECEDARALAAQDEAEAAAQAERQLQAAVTTARRALRDALVDDGGYVLCDNWNGPLLCPAAAPYGIGRCRPSVNPIEPLMAVEAVRPSFSVGYRLVYPGVITAPADDLPTQAERYRACLANLEQRQTEADQ